MGFTPRSATSYTALSFTLAKFPLTHVYAVAYVPPMAFIVQRFRRLFAALRRLPEVVRRGRFLTSSLFLLTSSLSSWRPARPAYNRAVCQRSTAPPNTGQNTANYSKTAALKSSAMPTPTLFGISLACLYVIKPKPQNLHREAICDRATKITSCH